MNSCQISFFVILAAAMCSAHIGGHTPAQDTQVYCGRTLARALALFCYEGPKNKRTEGSMYNAVLAPYYKEQELMQMDWPWVTPYNARGMNGQRGKRQLIVSECCDKPCSIDELLTYCNN